MSADGRGREWSRRCFFGYGLGPASLARSLGRRTRQRQIELISQWFCCVIAVVDVEDAPLSWPPDRARRQPPSPPRIAVDATPVRLYGRSSSFPPPRPAGERGESRRWISANALREAVLIGQ